MNASLNLLNRLASATVGIQSTVPSGHPSTAVLGSERQGTGVVLDRGSFVLTVNYVILGAETVRVITTDGKTIEMRVVAQDFAAGIALLDPGSDLGTGLTPRHSTEVSVGNEIVIVASTGDAERRVNDGIVTAIGPFEANWEYSLERALSTSAQSPGYGGAPICDTTGGVLGLSFLDAGEVGRFTLGIPLDETLEHYDELVRHGRRVTRPARAWIGFFCYTIRNHVIIAGVLPGAPAALAGLRAGDVLLAVDATQVNDRRQLYQALWAQPPGARFELSIYRDNGLRSVTVTAADAEEFFS